MSENEYISKILNRKVTKEFNNILEHTLKYHGKEAGAEDRVAISVAGDNKEHKKIAAELVDLTGFDTVDGGSLAESWRQQPVTPASCTELNAAQLQQPLADAFIAIAPSILTALSDELRFGKVFFF